MRERDIERYLVQRVKALDGEVRKVRWIGRRGAPDRFVMVPERKVLAWDGVIASMTICTAVPMLADAHGVWVELKASGVKPESYQLREHKRLQAMGQRVVVIDSIEGVDALLA